MRAAASSFHREYRFVDQGEPSPKRCVQVDVIDNRFSQVSNAVAVPMLTPYRSLPSQVYVLCLGSFLNRAGSFVLVFLTIYASERLGFGIPFASACMGIVGLGSMAGALLGGQLADQWGRRPVMLLALFGCATLLIVLSLQTNRWGFMLTLGAMALVSDMYRPAASAMIGDLVEPRFRSHAFALMYLSINLGFAIVPPLGGILAAMSFQWLFIGDAITTAAYGFVILLAVRETNPRTQTSRAHQEDALRECDPFEVGPLMALREIFSDRQFLLFCAASFLIQIVFAQGFSTFPLYLRWSGYSEYQVGTLLAINGALIAVLQLPLTHWLGRFDAMMIVTLGAVLIAVGFGMNVLQLGVIYSVITIMIWTMGEILQAPFKQAIVTEIAPEHLRARYFGVMSLCFGFSITIGAPLGGLVLDAYGPGALWGVMIGISATAVTAYHLASTEIRAAKLARQSSQIG